MATPPPPPPVPQRITIPLGAIVPLKSISIPLHFIPIGGGQYKVGIMIQARDQSGNSGDPQLFEFDTGGQGFWLNPSGQIPTPALGDCTINIQYTSGIQYWAQPQQLTLSFPEAEPPLVASAMVGVIGQMEDSKTNNTFPIFGSLFGDFGATLQQFTPTDVQATAGNGSGNNSAGPGLLTVLSQLPPPYNSGFVVDLGAYPGTSATTSTNGAFAAPQIIVGLSKPLRDLFPHTIAMTPAAPYTSPSGQQFRTFQEAVIQANYQITAPPPADAISTASNIGVVFDTGAPSTMLHDGTSVLADCNPAPNDQLLLTPVASSAFSLLSFQVGGTPGVNAAGSSSGDVLGIPAGYINTGITAFFQSPIMFDLENGRIGFPATSSS